MVIAVRGLTKHYRDVVAVDDISFDVERGSVFAFVGTNGAGKSTTIGCITTGLSFDEGDIRVAGHDVRRDGDPVRRTIGVVFQEPSLLTHLSVRGNLDYGARRSSIRGTSFDEVVDLLGLAPLLGRATTHLSGGERQRVALGRALLSQPRLLLMDEPLSSLDAASKAEILPYLERLHRALSIPALYISHDAGEIARLADSARAALSAAPGIDAAARTALADLVGVATARTA